jgi:outer membrane protein assembly factor BamB
VVSLALLLSLGALGQFGRGAGEWNTTGADAQRSSWVRTDAKISAAAIRKGGFGLAWKLKLTEPVPGILAFAGNTVLLNGYIGYRGFRSLGYIASPSGHVYAVDTDLGRLEWQRRIGPAPSDPPCTNWTGVVRPVTPAFPAAAMGGRGGPGRGTAARSGVGETDRGAVTIQEAAAREAAMAARGGGAGRGPGFGPGGPPRRMPNYVHAISADGLFHSMYVSNGDEPEKPVAFLPSQYSALDLIVLSDVAYAVSGPGCGGATSSSIWALDIESGKVASWSANTRGISRPAIAPDGTVYVTSDSGQLAALEAKTLRPTATYDGLEKTMADPLLFQFHDKTLIAVAGGHRIQLFDTAAIDRPYAQLPADADFSGSWLASWQDPADTRWMVAASLDGIRALKLTDKDGTPALTLGWTSGFAVHGAPLVINGVVFAWTTPPGKPTAYALCAIDGVTGKELWNSGSAIPARGTAWLSAGGSQIYLATREGVLYAFGFPIEH